MPKPLHFQRIKGGQGRQVGTMVCLILYFLIHYICHLSLVKIEEKKLSVFINFLDTKGTVLVFKMLKAFLLPVSCMFLS